MSDWTNSHDLVYAFVCVSFLADGEVDESEKEAMRGNVKVMLPDMGDDEYHQVEKEVIDKFIALGDETSRFGQYGSSLSAIKEMFSSDDDRYKVIKNPAYIARADQFIHENEMKQRPCNDLDRNEPRCAHCPHERQASTAGCADLVGRLGGSLGGRHVSSAD